ncbi:MAG: trehalose-phosphatase [Archangiaceae bacterium]|nr:trehalose-phosphatase [Archangiaceae bacterium]
MLAREHRQLFSQFAAADLLVGFDFDGTLAPIVLDPANARMRDRTRELLRQVCRLYPCVVVSGRAVADVRERLRGVGLLEIIGNHGLEPSERLDEFARSVKSWMPELREHLAAFSGVLIEDKLFSVAVHYRGCRDVQGVQRALAELTERLHPLRVIGGHEVVNLLPFGAPHKGFALMAARERLGCDRALYIGDDETDEDVFGHDSHDRLLSIRVGHRAGSRAPYFLESQLDVDALLERLTAFREHSRPHPAAKEPAAT